MIKGYYSWNGEDMRNLKKRLISFVLIFVMVFSMVMGTTAENVQFQGFEATASYVDGVLKVAGIGGNFGASVSVTILNEGKSFEELQKISNDADAKDIIKKMSAVKTGYNNKFEVNIKVSLEEGVSYIMIISSNDFIEKYVVDINGLSAFVSKESIVSNISYIEDEVTVRGYSAGYTKLIVLKAGKTINDYKNEGDGAVLQKATVPVDEDNFYEYTFKGLDYTDTDDCILITEAVGVEVLNPYFNFKKPYVITVESTNDANTAITNAIEQSKNKTDRPVEIVLKEGEYVLNEKITIANYYRTSECPLTIRAENGKKVEITGAEKIAHTDFKPLSLTDEKYFSVQEAVRDKIVKLDLSQFPEEVYTNSTRFLAEKTSGGYVHSSKLKIVPIGIYLNGNKQILARYPNEGYITTDVFENGDVKSVTAQPEHNEAITRLMNSTCKEKMLEGFLATAFSSETIPAGEITVDENGGKIVVEHLNDSNVGNYKPVRFKVINLIEEIDMAGEWYIDEEQKALYWYPAKKLTSADVIEIATVNDTLLYLSEVSHITIDGIEFSKNNTQKYDFDEDTAAVNHGSGLYIDKATDVIVENCIIHDVAMLGVYVGLFTERCFVNECAVYNTGGAGIYVGSFHRNYVAGEGIKQVRKTGSRISNCEVSNCGIYLDSGGITMNGVDVSGVNNTVHNTSGNGVGVNVVDGYFAKNEVYNVSQETQDSGGIYLAGVWTRYGNKIKNNLLHRIGLPEKVSHEHFGIFLDDAVGGAEVTGNIVVSDGRDFVKGMQIAVGPDNVIDGNIFVNTEANTGLKGIAFSNRTADRIIPRAREAYLYKFDGENISTYFKTYTKLAERLEVYTQIKDMYNGEVPSNNTELMEAFSEVYRMNNVVKDNIADEKTDLFLTGSGLNATGDKYAPLSDSDFCGNTNVDTSMFNNPAELDYRIKSNDYGKNVPSVSNFSMDSIGVQKNQALERVDKSFSLLYPNNNEKSAKFDENMFIMLSWEYSPFADGYIYEVAKDENFETIVASGETDNTYVSVGGFENETTYYWRVKALNQSRKGTKADLSVMCDNVYSFGTYVPYEVVFYGEPTIETVNQSETINNIAEFKGQEIVIKDIIPDASGIEESVEFTYILAIYNERTLVKAFIRKIDIMNSKRNDGPMFSSSIKLPEDLADGCTFKVFRWENLLNLKPIGNKYLIY